MPGRHQGVPAGHDLRSGPRRTRPAAALAAIFGLGLALAPAIVRADIHLVAPSHTIDPATPFRLSLIVTGEAGSRAHSLPEFLRVTLTPDLGAVARVELRRETPVPEQIELLRGEFRRIDYGDAVPANLRGRVRIDAIDLDAPAMLVQISTPRATAAAEPTMPPAVTAERGAQPEPAAAVPVPATTRTGRTRAA